MAEPFTGQIEMFGFNFPPQGWAFCHGQLMPISQNTALFSIIGNTYGGDGKSSFALPDLQDRAAIGAGQGPNLSAYSPGDTGGETMVMLQSAQMPSHSHAFVASADQGTKQDPQGNLLARASTANLAEAQAQAPGPAQAEVDFYSANAANATTALAPSAIGLAGANRPHNNLQPFLALNFCIALQGVMPIRS